MLQGTPCRDPSENKGHPVPTVPPLILLIWMVFHDDVLPLLEMNVYQANA